MGARAYPRFFPFVSREAFIYCHILLLKHPLLLYLHVLLLPLQLLTEKELALLSFQSRDRSQRRGNLFALSLSLALGHFLGL